jgi:hypothetical protein
MAEVLAPPHTATVAPAETEAAEADEFSKEILIRII